MTTIAYRNGVMAADSRAYSGDKVPIGSKAKIHRLDDGGLLGITSTVVGLPERFVEFVNSGLDPSYKEGAPDDPHLSALWVKPNGDVMYFAGWLPTGPVIADYYAIGSGEQYALAAMCLGYGPEAAVTVACEFDIWSAEPIHALSLKLTVKPHASAD